VIVYPAVDIRGGRCVRLVEGDFTRETQFDADPVDAARRWTESGAEWLHVVDLDGAFAGVPVNVDAITRIRAAVDVPIQLGGGLRELTDLEWAMASGIDRVILGTAALRDPRLVESAVGRWGEAIAVALDARDGLLATDAWLGQSDARAVDVAQQLAAIGVHWFIFTDISRDGTLGGPNIQSLQNLMSAVTGNFIASGGIASLEDIVATRDAGAAGTIVGRALYDGRVDLAAAIRLAHRDEVPSGQAL
jgi:phosphoribosylformimino-5-aminoimidazole carboxamide ribotide isomerase